VRLLDIPIPSLIHKISIIKQYVMLAMESVAVLLRTNKLRLIVSTQVDRR